MNIITTMMSMNTTTMSMTSIITEHHEHHHHHHCHHHHGLENEESGEALEYNIQTFVYYARRPFDINFFDDFVARQWPKQIIVVKVSAISLMRRISVMSLSRLVSR